MLLNPIKHTCRDIHIELINLNFFFIILDLWTQKFLQYTILYA